MPSRISQTVNLRNQIMSAPKNLDQRRHDEQRDAGEEAQAGHASFHDALAFFGLLM